MSGWKDRMLTDLTRRAIQRAKTEREIAELVAQLRAQNCPWSVIGDALGITRQGAQQRFGSHEV